MGIDQIITPRQMPRVDMQRYANHFNLPDRYKSHILQRWQARPRTYSLIFASNLVMIRRELSELGLVRSFLAYS